MAFTWELPFIVQKYFYQIQNQIIVQKRLNLISYTINKIIIEFQHLQSLSWEQIYTFFFKLFFSAIFVKAIISMLKRLNIFTNSAQTDLTQAMIDKNHQKIKFGYANRIFKKINNQKYLTNLLSALKKSFKSSSNTLKIKSFVMLHYLMRKSVLSNQRINDFAENELNEMKCNKQTTLNTTKLKIMVQNQQKDYIQKNIIQFYILYLLKFIAHRQAYIQAKRKTQVSTQNFDLMFEQKYQPNLDTTSQTKLQTNSIKYQEPESALMSHINNGFEILNLINFILQSQESFNKMGRYYIEQDEILNLFVMYLDDLTIYNDYTKRLAKVITRKINNLKEEEIKHCFLYLTQSQKISDRLYEFYYNRYYYNKVKKLIILPTFLTISSQDFQRVVKEIKKTDKELFLAVKESKYSQEYKMNKTMGFNTEPSVDRDSSLSKSSKNSKMNHTMMTQTYGNKDMHLRNINNTIEDLKLNSISMRQIQQNITKYIECFQDIDGQQFI